MATIEREGVKLHHVEAGSGGPPMVFIHGWTGDNTYFAPQAEHFAATRRCVSVDLRGHGSSDAPEQEYTMSGFADDVAALCGELGLVKPVVVGHSMGGAIALAIAASYPDVPGAVVLVDSPVLVPPETAAAVAPAIEALRSPGYRDVASGFIASFFLPTDDQDMKARIIDGVTSAPQHVMASSIDQLFAWDSESAAKGCSVPVLYIAAGQSSLTDHVKFRELCPQLMIGQTVGSGHFNQLLVPDQVNGMIDRFLAVNGV